MISLFIHSQSLPIPLLKQVDDDDDDFGFSRQGFSV